MQRKPHPNHHLPLVVIPIASVLGLVTMAVVLSLVLKDQPTLLYGILGAIAVAETVAVLVVLAQAKKSCQCPGCGATLMRDTDPLEPGNQYPCAACDTVWVSKFGGGRIDT
ncbi:MAG: hypothetical protein ACPGYV_03170 [Phycisphaeraceae bacterium]